MTNGQSHQQATAKDWIFIAALALAYVLSGVDRQILAFLAPAVKRDLDLSDLQIGILQGFAFAIFYAVAGLPMGWLIDRFSRTRVIGLALTFWSGMTALCGISSSFGVLAAARMGVGAGEAALTPGAYSIMAERFSPRQLGRASLIYSLGAPASLALAAALSGVLQRAGGSAGLIELPLVGQWQAWRVAFLTAAAPGIIVGVGLFLIRDRRRSAPAPSDAQPIGLGAFLKGHWRTHVVFAVGSSAIVAIHYATTSWSPTILSRTFGWSPVQIATALGTIGLVGGVAGCILGGLIADRLLGRASQGAVMRAMTVVAIGLVALSLGAWMTKTATSFVLVVGLMLTLTSLMLMLMPTFLQTITPAALRGRMTAFYLLMSIGLGAGSGPALVGAASSFVFGARFLQPSFCLVVLSLGLVAILSFGLANARLGRSASLD